jgi:hypothetical protein
MMIHLVQYTVLRASSPSAPPICTSSLHRCWSLRQSALITLCPYLIFFLMSNFSAVSFRYVMMLSPVAIGLLAFHGLNWKPKVCRSESDRTPGYLNCDHVPPSSWRASRRAKELSGSVSWTRYAALMPEMPLPIMRTSKCVSSAEPFAVAVPFAWPFMVVRGCRPEDVDRRRQDQEARYGMRVQRGAECGGGNG